MSNKYNESCKIISQDKIASDVYSMWIQTEAIARAAVPGQFISLFCQDRSRLLPRPISICEIDRVTDRLRIVYRILGKGTNEFSTRKAGEEINIMGPLGNGFPILDKKTMLIGGGIGIPPMLELAKQLSKDNLIVSGYRDELFLIDDLKEYGEVYVATEDGSAGTRGNVLDAIKANNLQADVIYACGPTPMLRAVKQYAAENNIECYLSMEERMACGIGACLACVCRSGEVDEHTNVHNKRVCKDGPVFLSREVEI